MKKKLNNKDNFIIQICNFSKMNKNNFKLKKIKYRKILLIK